ncbi:MAG: LysM peptidoglycan-binding domain-containing protein [Anaerolineae bacterium]
MERHPIVRFLAALFSGILMFALILGNIHLAQLDPTLVWVRPTRVSLAPTATYYPTVPPPHTPQPTETPLATATPRSILIDTCEPPTYWLPYVVQPGDTLTRLAVRTALPVHVLLRENCLGSPQLQAGTTIYLPPQAVISPTAPAYTCGPPWNWKPTIVLPGDTLYSLAVRYGTTIQAIRHANCLTGYTIYAGSRLYLPPQMVITPTWTPTPAPTLTPTPTPSASATSTPSPTHTPTVRPTVTVTVTVTPVATTTITPTPSPTPSPSVTSTATLTPTPTEPLTVTPSPTPTAAFTPSPTPTATETPATPTSPSPTPSPSSTPSPQPTTTSTPTEQAD